MEKQLQYWRKKSFYQKARDARWDKMKATRGEISVNVGSKFTGVVVEKDEEPAKGTQLYALDISYLTSHVLPRVVACSCCLHLSRLPITKGRLCGYSGLGMSSGLQAGSLSSKRPATGQARPKMASGRSRGSKSVPGALSSVSASPPPIKQPLPLSQIASESALENSEQAMDGTTMHSSMAGEINRGSAVGAGLDAVGVAEDMGTLKHMSKFKPASAALKDYTHGQEVTAKNSQSPKRAPAVGALGTGITDPFGVPKSFMNLVSRPGECGAGGSMHHGGEVQHRRVSVAGHGDTAKSTFGGELQGRGRSGNSPGASDRTVPKGMGAMLRSPPGHISQRRRDGDSPLDNMDLLGPASAGTVHSHAPGGARSRPHGYGTPHGHGTNFSSAAHDQDPQLRCHPNIFAPGVDGVPHAHEAERMQERQVRHIAGLQTIVPPSVPNDSPNSLCVQGGLLGQTTLELAQSNDERSAPTAGIRPPGKIVARKRIQVRDLSS